jgi:hypothetical protein
LLDVFESDRAIFAFGELELGELRLNERIHHHFSHHAGIIDYECLKLNTHIVFVLFASGVIFTETKRISNAARSYCEIFDLEGVWRASVRRLGGTSVMAVLVFNTNGVVLTARFEDLRSSTPATESLFSLIFRLPGW